MKYSTTEVFIIWLALTLNCFTQDKNFKEVFPGKLTNKGLKEIHNPNVDALQRISDIDSLLLKSLNNTWKTALRNPKREFYEEEEFNDKDTRTTINKTLLGDGFLLIEESGQIWDSYNSAWVNYSKDSYVYDVNNDQTEWLRQFWGGSDWENYTKHLYTYDVNNNQIEDLWYFWIYNWVNYSKKSFTYDGNNNLTELLNQAWQDPWANEYKHSYAYDGNNNLTEWLGQDWNGSAWVNSFKKFYTYDGNNNQIEEIWHLWDRDNSAWRNHYKYSYAYDINNNLIETLTYVWDGSAWVNYGKDTYTYDGNNNLTEKLRQYWDNSVLVNYEKYSYIYDGNNNPTEYLNQSWDGSAWLNIWKYSYTYNGNNNLTEELYQTGYGFDWVNGFKLIYSYIPTDVTEITNEFNDYSLSNNYPNPFNPSTTIRYSISTTSQVTIKVFDILGNEIKTIVDGEMSPGKYEVLFDASGLSSGTYFYQLRTENFIQTQKMLILK